MKKGLDHAHTSIILSIIGIILVFLSIVIGSLVLSEMMKSTVPAEESSVDTTTASQEAVVSTAIYHPSNDTDVELLKYDKERKVEYDEESSSTSSIEESSVVSEDERDTYEEESDTTSTSKEIEETSSEESSEYCEDVYSEETSYIPEVKQPTQDEEEAVEEQIEDSEPDTESTPAETETENTYTDEDLYYLTCVIVGEGQNVSFEEQIAVASVVVNRLHSEWFNYDTIKEVCTAPGQYSSFSNGMAYREPTEENIAAAEYVLKNGSQLPGNCIFQSLHQQGNGVYQYFEDTGTYICYK